jgi:SAM-dependent methyltransferase
LRRLVRARLADADDAGPSRRIDYRAVTRTVLATTVGSAFEADWAYLQLARTRLPATYRTLLDRWCGWFIHCDAAADFPRFVKTHTPASDGVALGPFADKHAAQRAIERLQDAFDLCRYHHILVEAPNAAACAYKEMGKCPAPCDGTISMDRYRAMIEDAIRFGAGDDDVDREALTSRMQAASAELDFERARRLKGHLDAADAWSRPDLRFVDRLDRFRYLAVLPSERPDRARLILILGGWIEPWLDVPLEPSPAEAREIRGHVDERLNRSEVVLTTAAMQNVGLVCWHLFKPKRAQGPGTLLRLRGELGSDTFSAALRALRADSGGGAGSEGGASGGGIADNEIGDG